MPFTLTVLILAIGISYLRGGRLHRIADAPLRWPWLLFLGLSLQVVVNVGADRGFLDHEVGSYLLLLLSQVLVLVWVVANWRLPGMVLVGVGLFLNSLVIGANGAMPVSPEAMQVLGVEDQQVPPGKHTLMTEDTRLPWLADIWALPPLRSVISIGDVVLAAGLVPVTHGLMSYRPPAERRRRRDAREQADDVEPAADTEVTSADGEVNADEPDDPGRG